MDAFDNPARNGMAGLQRDGAATDQSNGAIAGSDLLAAATNATATAAAMPLAIQGILVPDASGRIVLPAGASIDDITVSGTDLIVTLPGGQVFIIPNGAVDVPAIVVDGDTVPASTVAQLLEDLGDFNPEAGVRSSGGNFADPAGPIQDAYALGDLLPYTELAFPQPEDRELLPDVPDEEPEVVIVTPDQPAGAAAATASVDEAGLPAREGEPAGSDSAATSETTTGSIVYDAADGLDAITINGTVITTVGQVITTPLGELTITSLTPGNVGYSYTLADNSDANANLTDIFAVAVTDSDGDTATATLTIDIVDDVPTARADTDQVAAGSFAPETGNVLTGAGTTSGTAGSDTPGADGATLTGVRPAGSEGGFAAPGVVAGQYGTLTLNADGSYSYVRSPGTPGGVDDVFTYQITDGDGDTSTATLTISIADSPTVITFVPGDGEGDGGTIVYEADLPGRDGETPGSAFGGGEGGGASTSGTITFTAIDGVGSVSLGGTVITPGSLPQTVSSDATGTLVVTGYTYDPATGEGSVTYAYTLVDNTLEDDGTTVSFDLTITDGDGDAASDTLDIRIVDDAPTARADADSVTEDGPLTADGNVLTGSGGSDANGSDGVADVQGADGASVTAVAGGAPGEPLAGAYGTLTLNSDGSYSYVLNNGAQPVQGLAAGETLTETFTYTITDGDGDTATTTLTITINGADDGVTVAGLDAEGAELTVDEDDLADGSSPDAAALTQDGSFTIATPDGLANVTIGGVAVVTNGVFAPATVASPLGTVNVTGFTPVTGADGSVIGGSFTYEYVLADNTLTHGADGQDSVTDSFAVVVTDGDGSSANASLDVRIIDDVPTARDDVDGVTEDGPLTADGNVLTGLGGGDANATDGVADTQGADGTSVTAVAGGAIGAPLAGAYGTLTLNGDGSYSYVLDNAAQPVQGLAVGETLTESFTYTITDGDGDPSSATLTITINGADDGVTIEGLDVEGGEVTVDEDDLADGSSPDAAALTQPGSFTISTPDGLGDVTIGGVQVVTNGVFTAGTATSAIGTINITGFTPVIGADGSVIGGSFTYEYVLADNTLTHMSPGEDFVGDSFAVVVTDSDGSSANASLDVRIIDDVPAATDDSAAAAEDMAVTIDVLANDVRGADGVDPATGVALATAPAKGNVVYNGDGSFTYTPTPGEEGEDSFTYTITDGDGDTSTATVTVMLAADSTPTLSLGADNSVDEAGLPAGSDAASNSETATGSFTLTTGNDSVASLVINGVDVTAGGTVTTPLGILTVTESAGTYSYSYTLTTNTSGDDTFDSFAAVLTDSDGDTATDTLVIDIIDDVPTARPDADSVTEDGPLTADGNVLTGSGGGDANATDGVLDTQGADGASVTAVSFGATAGSVGAGLAGAYGTLTLNSDGSYSYALDNAAQPVQGLSVGDTLTEVFTYTITDGDGDPSTTTLTITINGADDGVTITGLDAEGAELFVDEDDLPARAGEAPGSDTSPDGVTDGDSFSVSTPDGMGSVVLDSFNGVPLGLPLTLVTAGGSFTPQSVVTAYGTLNITGFTPVTGVDGSVIGGTFTYSYTLTDNRTDHPAMGQDDRTDSIGVTVTDIDGSSASAAIDIRITDDVPDAIDDGTTQALENAPVTIDVLANDVQGADSVQPGAVELVAGSLTGAGSLVNNGDGSFTYTPAAQETGTVSFQYRVTDGDGDTDIAMATITLVADSAPQIRNADDVTVDEDGLSGANIDNGLAGEVTSTGSASATGSITVDFGSDIPAVLAGSLVLNDSAALDTQLTVNNVAVTFAKDGDDLVGSVGGNEVIRISLTGTSAGPGATEVTYGYSVTLAQAIDQAVPGSEDSDFLSGIGFTVTDSDGTTASGAFDVTIVDDLPTLTVSDTPTSVVEGATANGSWTLDAGADGVASVLVSFGSGSATLALTPGSSVSIAQPTGTLTVNSDGRFSFAASNNQNDATNPSATFTLSAVDRDGDPTSDSLTIAITDGADPVDAAPITLTVNEAAIDAIGSDPASGDEIDSGNLSFTAGSDTLSGFAFTGFAGLVTNLDGAGIDIFWSMAPDGQTITGSLTMGGPAAITISLTAPASIAPGATANASVTVTLADNLPHELAMAAQTQSLGTVTVQASDTDGDLATGVVTVQVTDDIPVAAPDADSVTEDGALIADGNVLTGSGGGDANATDGVADEPGADGASVTALVGGTVGVPLVSTYGTLTLNADGSYSYALDNANTAVQGLSAGDMLTETFTYTITDGDGDPAITTLTITINGANDGVTINGLAVPGGEETVDEDDLVDGSSPNAAALTQPGSFTVDAPDGLNNVTIGTAQVMVNGVFTPGLTTISALGTLTITGFTPVLAADNSVIGGTFTYEYVLDDNTLTHPAAGEDNVTDSFAVTVTDSDGSIANADLDINVIDDVPTASAEPNQNVAEGATVTGTLDFVQGADGASVTAINGTALTFGMDGFSQAIDIGDGTIMVKADGSYSFTADASVAGIGSASATYMVTDGDGDTSTAPISFTIVDANAPTAGTTQASVDDDALLGGNPASTTGDLPDPNSDGDNDQATFSGLLNLDFGGDGAGSVSFAAMDGDTAMVGTEEVTYDWDAGSNTLTATGPRGVLFTVEVTNPATGAYTVTLVDNVLHSSGGDENDASATLGFVVSDSDGSTAPGTLTITFDDDAPTLGTISGGSTSNDPSAVVTTGAIPFVVGADAPAMVGTITADVSGMTSGGHTLVTTQAGNVLTAYADTDNDGIYDPGTDTAVFTLTVDPGANQYVFDLLAPLDGDVVNTPISGASSFGAGPTQSQILTGDSSDVAIVAGWMTTGGFDPADWYSTGATNPAGLTLSSVNGSTNGWGIANQNFNQGEFMRFDFGAPTDDFDGAGAYSAPSITLPEVSYATFELTNFSAADTLQIVVHYTDGTFGNQSVAGNSGPLTLQAPAGKFIDWIDIYGQTVGGGGGKISLTNAGVTTTTVNETVDFTITLTDADGDPITGGFSVNVSDNSPTARNDEVSLTEGGPVTVNFDVDTNDNPGTDGFGSRTFASLTGTYGTITLNGDGTQTYTLNATGQAAINALAPGQTLTDIFDYTLTDTDGDSDSARVTVTLTGVDDPVIITNLTPSAGGGDATVDEDDLPTGSDTMKESLTATGTFDISAPDGVANLSVGGTQVIADGVFTPATIMTPLGNTLSITAYNAATGQITYNYTLNDAATHPNDQGENDLFEDFSVSLTDADGDVAIDTLSVRIIDDVPSVNLVATNEADVVLTTQDAETIGAAADTAVSTADFGGVFNLTSAYGADGAGSTGLSYALSLVGTNGTDSTLDSNGASIFLYTGAGGTIVGSTSASAGGVNAANTIFTLGVSPAGAVTLTQFAEIDHAPNGDTSAPYDDQFATLANGLVRLTGTATITDADNDMRTSTAFIDLGGNIRFADDGPSITAGTPLPTLTVDESNLGANAVGAAVFTTSFGADGPGTVTYALGINAGSTGLVDTATGQPVVLTLSGGQVVATAGNGGPTVFTVAVDAGGNITLDQIRAIAHDTDGGPGPAHDDAKTLAAANLITLTGTITDGDGDSAQATINLGQRLTFKDDGPSATADSGTTSEATLDFNAAFVIDFSGSIDNTELNTMLNAVREAGLLLFGSSSGDVSIRIVGFSSTASNLGVFTDPVAFVQAIDSFNPAVGGTRPFNGGTDFTAGIEQLMDVYVPNPNASNQVFFLSDGNPNEQTGSGGNSLADATRADWIDFVNDNDVNVTAIGVGNGISIPRLQDVDVDGEGAPILAADFDDLVQTLLDIVVALPVTGDIDANDSFGADGGRIHSITVDGTTYSWDGANLITRTGANPGSQAGNSMTATTPNGATLTLNFATGIWSYAPPENPIVGSEQFAYTVIDGDGDTAPSMLTVTVAEGGGPGGGNIATADLVITNASGSGAAIAIAEAALLANDQPGATITGSASNVVDAASVVRGGGTFTFTDNDGDGGSFFYSTSPSDSARVTVNRAQAGESTLDGTSASEILVGRDGAADTVNGRGGNDYLYGLGGDDALVGGDGDDVMDGGAGNDILKGGSGNDRLTGGSGNDQFRFATNSGSDIVTDYTDNQDKIAFFDDGDDNGGSVNFGATTGSAAGTTLNANDFQTRATVDDIAGGDDDHVVRLTSAQTEAQITSDTGGSNSQDIYVLVFNSTTGKGEIWFDTDWDNTGNRVKIATLDNVTTLAQLNDITNTDIVVYNNGADPIILDLDGNGYLFDAVATFDINADGAADSVAWNSSGDGMLAIDLNGNGRIDNGAELFTPDFADGGFASGVAALDSLDGNGDGVIDVLDAAYADLLVWQDTNADGISDAGEVSRLADLGIASISTRVAAVDEMADGQTVTARGGFTRDDGTAGGYVEVRLDTQFGTRTTEREGAENQRAAGHQALTSTLVAASLVAMVDAAQPDGVQPLELAAAPPSMEKMTVMAEAEPVEGAAGNIVATATGDAPDALADLPVERVAATHADEATAALLDTLDDRAGRSIDRDAEGDASEALFDIAANPGEGHYGTMDGLLALGALAIPAAIVAANDPAATAVLAEVLDEGNAIDRLIDAVAGSAPVELAHTGSPAFDLAQFLDQKVEPDAAFASPSPIELDLHQMATA